MIFIINYCFGFKKVNLKKWSNKKMKKNLLQNKISKTIILI